MSGRASAAARGYGSKWQQARAGFLAKHPLCVMCEAAGRTEAATVVDHKEPHRRDWAKFWDRNNWQPLCEAHHNRTKQRIEKSKGEAAPGTDRAGRPTDPAHPWNGRAD